jgi:predicted nuclease of predicted toxin-antitoxin system
MAKIRLLLDEDVRPLLAEILRQRGYDAVHVLELGRTGESDAEQLEFAVDHGQAILTHNIRDFTLLDRQYRQEAKVHCGILLSDQITLGSLLQRTLRFLGRHNPDDVKNNVFWLTDEP